LAGPEGPAGKKARGAKLKTYPSKLKTISLLGVRLTLCSKTELLASIGYYILKRQKTLILSGNVHSFNLAYKNPWLREYFNQADIVRLDGAGLRMGAFILGHETPPRITLADFAWNLSRFCEAEGFRLFFLGSLPGIAEKAAEKLKQRFPKLQIVGTCNGYFEKNLAHPENKEIIHTVNVADTDILIVGMGMPLQEKWLKQNRHSINAPVIMTAGSAFEWIADEKPRAPRWMRDNGMEWLWRLRLEPGRLAKRYLIGNPLFLWRIMKEKLVCATGKNNRL